LKRRGIERERKRKREEEWWEGLGFQTVLESNVKLRLDVKDDGLKLHLL